MSEWDGAGISGIVLAGGRSRRFGADKLTAEVGGRPLLHHAITALAAVSREVIVVVGTDAVPPLPRGIRVPLHVIRDEVPGAGPLGGLVTGLREALGSIVVLAGGDMPSLVPDVLRELAAQAAADGADAAVLCDGDTRRPLPSAMRRDTALKAAAAVRSAGGSSLRSLLAALRVAEIPEAAWRVLDPAGASLVDVDRPEDLDRLRGRAR